jgi:hypothetical protein
MPARAKTDWAGVCLEVPNPQALADFDDVNEAVAAAPLSQVRRWQ